MFQTSGAFSYSGSVISTQYFTVVIILLEGDNYKTFGERDSIKTSLIPASRRGNSVHSEVMGLLE